MHKLRRQVVVWIRPEWIMELLAGWKQHSHVVLPLLEGAAWPDGTRLAIPRDVRLVSVQGDWQRQSIGVVLEHPSFAAVDDGNALPDVFLREATIFAIPAKPDEANPDVMVVSQEDVKVAAR